MSEKPACLFCGQNDEQQVLIPCRIAGEEGYVCMRCFHPLMHGMSPGELKQRIQMARKERA